LKEEHNVMKKPLLAIACAVACSIPLSAVAQQAAPASSSATGAVDAATLAKLRERIRNDRKGLVAQNLPLTDAEAKAFWPVYERCHESIEAAQRKANRAIVEYVSAESQMTDAHARQIVGEVLEAEADGARARKSCFDRVAKVLPGKKAARYFQIETKIAALSRFDVATTLPLVH
jgi:Spy/CpxP family protein refolding chaperone